jgi:hypothetical protein
MRGLMMHEIGNFVACADDCFDVKPTDEIPGHDGDEDRPCWGCHSCGTAFGGFAYFDGEYYHCEGCAEATAKRWTGEALAFAREHCRVTGEIPEYDAEDEYRCTPEEYEYGQRESHTPNAFLCWCRHNLTNYESLIAKLSRDHARDRVYYAAIRHHIDELITSHDHFPG